MDCLFKSNKLTFFRKNENKNLIKLNCPKCNKFSFYFVIFKNFTNQPKHKITTRHDHVCVNLEKIVEPVFRCLPKVHTHLC